MICGLQTPWDGSQIRETVVVSSGDGSIPCSSSIILCSSSIPTEAGWSTAGVMATKINAPDIPTFAARLTSRRRNR